MRQYILRKDYQSAINEYYAHYLEKPGHADMIRYLRAGKNRLYDVPIRKMFRMHPRITDRELLEMLNQYDMAIDSAKIQQTGSLVAAVQVIPEEKDIFVMQHFQNLKAEQHMHDYFELHYIIEGTCTFYYENEERLLKKGEFCIISPFSMHDISAEGNEAIVITIAIRNKLFDSAFSAFLSQNNLLAYFFRKTLYNPNMKNYLLFFTKEEDIVKTLIKNLTVEEVNYDNYSNVCAVSWLNLLFCVIMRYHSRTDCYCSIGDNNKIYHLLQYISEHFETVSLQELSVEFHYSKSYICKLLKKYANCTLQEIVTELRMQKAKRYLDNTKMTILEVAEKIGCRSSEQFSKIFHKKYGVSPTEYRKQNRKS